HAQGVAERRHVDAVERGAREEFAHERQQGVEVRFDQGADQLDRQAFRRRIDREHAALGRALGVRSEVHVLARLDLAPGIESHAAAHEQHVALVDRAVQERLARPGDLDHAGVVAQHGLEDAETLARREDAFGDHRADDRRIHAGLQRRDRGDGAGVLVAMRDVVQQVARGHYAQAREELGAMWSDTLEICDGCLEVHTSSRSSFENSTASKVARSVRLSPVPMNLTGTSMASCTATTIPPFAVPSTLVTTKPVTGTAAAKVFACTTAFCPMVPSRTNSVSCGAPGFLLPSTRTIFFN